MSVFLVLSCLLPSPQSDYEFSLFTFSNCHGHHKQKHTRDRDLLALSIAAGVLNIPIGNKKKIQTRVTQPTTSSTLWKVPSGETNVRRRRSIGHMCTRFRRCLFLFTRSSSKIRRSHYSYFSHSLQEARSDRTCFPISHPGFSEFSRVSRAVPVTVFQLMLNFCSSLCYGLC